MIQAVNYASTRFPGLQADILRLDQLHPVVSGNKSFKLSGYIRQAQKEGKTGLASMGGAWSNHLHALAWAARQHGLSSIGWVRGDAHVPWSPTLQDAHNWGMELRFLSRQDYRHWGPLLRQSTGSVPQAALPSLGNLPDHFLLVPEGGYGITGARGASGIWNAIPDQPYSHILCAVGTGTMMAGLIQGAVERGVSSRILGIPVLNAGPALEADIRALLPASLSQYPILLEHGYHGGGYAKTSEALLRYMSELYHNAGIPTDIIYTAKLMYALDDLLVRGYFPAGSRILVIHSGGLQGNRSLKTGVLPF